MVGTPGFVGPDDIGHLRDAGMEIGSHGAAHVKWTTLDDAELTAQVDRSLRILSGVVGQPITSIAVPFGAYNRRVLRVLNSFDLVTIFTSDGGSVRPGTRLKSRNSIRMDTSLEAIEILLCGLPIQQRIRFASRRWVRRHF
jgi:peptidoglycan/xylan/chitin deacetylase (PgdA/CDA1 family)